MSLLKMKLKAAVLAGIAGVLVFAGGAFAAASVSVGTQSVALTAGTAGTAKFTITMTELASDASLSVAVSDASSFLSVTSGAYTAPTGVTWSLPIFTLTEDYDGSGNGLGTYSGTVDLTVTVTVAAQAAVVNDLKFTIASITSSAFTFTIGPDNGQNPPPSGTAIQITTQPSIGGAVFVGNINSKLTVVASVANIPAFGADSLKDASILRYTWYSVAASVSSPADAYFVTSGQNTQNAWMVRGTQAGPDGASWQLDPSLRAQTAGGDSTYKFLVVVSSSEPRLTELRSNLVTVTVSARPLITIEYQPADSTGKADGYTTFKLGVHATATGGVTPAYQWYWVSNATGVGGGTLGDVGGANTDSVEISAGLPTGVYYYRAEVSANNAVQVRSNVARVVIGPATGKTQLPATAVYNVPEITEIPYQVPTLTGSSGTKLRLTLPSTVISSGGTTGKTYKWTNIKYTRVLTSNNTPVISPTIANGNVFEYDLSVANAVNQGVDKAGTYDVEITVESSDASNAQVGRVKVRFIVTPRNLSLLTAANVKILAPVDSVYDGLVKTPRVTLIDGSSTQLLENTDFEVVQPATGSKDWIDAGTVTVTVNGKAGGNYTGSRTGTFTIRRHPIIVNVEASQVDGKDYDGTDTLSADNVRVILKSAVTGVNLSTINNTGTPILRQKLDFSVSGPKFDVKDAGLRTVNNINVKLEEATSLIAKNYTFGAAGVAAVSTTTFSVASVRISKATPTVAYLKYNVDTTHLFNDQPRGIGTVEWKSGVTNPSQSPFTIYYTQMPNGSATSTLPKGSKDAESEYVVAVDVRGGTNFNDGVIQIPETYVIHTPKAVEIETKPARKLTGADSTVYIGMPLVLTATGVKPDSVMVVAKDAAGNTIKDQTGLADSLEPVRYKGGTLSYQWYKLPSPTADGVTQGQLWDTLKTRGGNTASYTLPQPLKEGDEYYQVRVIYAYPAVQIPDTAWLKVSTTRTALTIHIGPEPLSLADAEVSVTGSWVYDGTRKVIAQGEVAVTLGGSTLTYDDDYTFTSYGLNAGSGAGTVTVTGKNAYKGTVIGYFDIDKIATTEADLSFGTTKQYNDSVQEFSVTAQRGLTGLGAVTRSYFTKGDDDVLTPVDGAPKAVGNYVVKVSIAEGTNFAALDEFERTYSIVKRVLTKTDFTYTLPEEHAYTGVAKPAVTATLKSNVKGYTGTQRVVYLLGNEQLTAMPVDEGKYEVAVDVSGDANFANAMVILGIYEIHEEGWVGVKGSDRVVPTKPATEVAAIAPVKVVASGFTAGPSPVRNGEVIKFFSKSNVKSGSLYIFDQSGNSVAKVKASGSGEIGSWKVSTASAGSYVVKGVLIGKDGTKEKVSFVFAVTK